MGLEVLTSELTPPPLPKRKCNSDYEGKHVMERLLTQTLCENFKHLKNLYFYSSFVVVILIMMLFGSLYDYLVYNKAASNLVETRPLNPGPGDSLNVS